MSLVHRREFVPLPLAAAVVLALAPGARAATIVVNDPSPTSVPGKCSIVDAVAALNTASTVNACVAGNGSNDTIDLTSLATPATITFGVSADGNSALALSKSATIRAGVDAGGQPLVTLMRSSMSGTPNFRLISTTKDLSITGLSLRNGNAANRGGALYAIGAANLQLNNSSVIGNVSGASGGGISADCGNIGLTNSTVSGNSAAQNGGGVYTTSQSGGSGHCTRTITLRGTKVSGNTATGGAGGGVCSFYGNVYAVASTFDGNHADGDAGGGVFGYVGVRLYSSTVSNNTAQTSGGGAWAHDTMYLTNTTVTQNDAQYDTAAVYGYTLDVTFSTITKNNVHNMYPTLGSVGFHKGRFSDGTPFVYASIISGNTTYGSAGGDNIHGHAAVMGNYNIIGPSGTQVLPAPPATLTCAPNLGPLADNGGPTQTMAPSGSCAIDAGPPRAPPLIQSDQRGELFARRVGAATDIGALEVQSNVRVFYDGFEAK